MPYPTTQDAETRALFNSSLPKVNLNPCPSYSTTFQMPCRMFWWICKLSKKKAISLKLDRFKDSKRIGSQILACLRITYVCSIAKSSNSWWPHGLQHAKLLCPLLSPWVYSNSCPLSWWCYLAISSSVTCFPFAFSLSQYQGLFQWVSSSHQVAKVLELQLQHQSFQWIFKVDFL